MLAKIDPRLYQAALDQAKAKKGAGRGAARLGPEGSRALQDAGAQELRDPADRRPAAGQGRSAQGLDRGRRGRDRDRADAARLHHHHGAERRPHRRAPGRSRQHRARLRPGPIATLTLPQPIGGPVHAAGDARSTTCATPWRAAPVEVTAFDQDNARALSTGTLLLIDNLIDQATATIRLKAMFANEDERAVAGRVRQCAGAARDPPQRRSTVPSTAVQRGPQGLFTWVVDERQHRRAASDRSRADRPAISPSSPRASPTATASSPTASTSCSRTRAVTVTAPQPATRTGGTS